MKKYTFIVEYRGGTYISQYFGVNLFDALSNWSLNLDKKIYTKKKREQIQSEVNIDENAPILLDTLSNVWCTCYLSGKFFVLLNIVETV